MSSRHRHLAAGVLLSAMALIMLCAWSEVRPAERFTSAQQVAPCPATGAYPGDDAPKPAIAGWMASGASAVALPRELPVMGALEESGLANLPGGDADRVGYFQMRVGIWNQGSYAGFPDKPELQLRWFTDHAAQMRQQRIAAGRPDPAADEAAWGDWIADVLLPPAQYRGRYQLRLAQARQLIGPPCTINAPSPQSPPPPPRVPDTTAPTATLLGKTSQKLAKAIAVAVSCNEPCTATATGKLSLPNAAARHTLKTTAGSIAAGGTLKLKLEVPKKAHQAARKALTRGKRVKANLKIVVRDAAGQTATKTRTVKLTL